MKIRTAFGTLLILALLTAGRAQALDKAKLDRFLDRLAEKRKAMGSLTIARDGNVVYSRAIGYALIDSTTRKPLSTSSRFRIGSVTKMFTATMVLQLVEDGKLNLTDTLDKFLPQIPNAKAITIEHILSHRSGIPNIKRPQNAAGNINTLPFSRQEHLALIVNTPPDFRPGTRSAYSNAGYFVLGLILEKVTGQSYEEVLKGRISSRIGLADTYTTASNVDLTRNECHSYMHFGGDWKRMPETHPSIFFGAGAIVSTPDDLVRFVHALFEGNLVSKATLERMTAMRDGEGFGMSTFTFAGRTFYGHTGGADNYGAWLAYEPKKKLAVAYATNAKIHPVENIVRGAIDIYYDRPFQIPSLESIELSPEILDRYVGSYSSPEGPGKVVITRKGSTLHFQPPGESSGAPLEAIGENKFQIEGAAVFTFEASGNHLSIHRRGREIVLTKDK